VSAPFTYPCITKFVIFCYCKAKKNETPVFSRLAAFSELRSLPSTGVTRLPRYYEPLRHPIAPGLSVTGVRLVFAPDHAMGLPVLHRSSSCMHAVANTPAEPQGARFALFPSGCGLPRCCGGSASASDLSRPARRSPALRPAHSPDHFHDPLHRGLQTFRCLRACPDCYRLKRKLPGGIRTL